jgi:hypothetical protein
MQPTLSIKHVKFYDFMNSLPGNDINSSPNTVSYYRHEPRNKTKHQIKQFDSIQHFHYKGKSQLLCGNEVAVPPDFLLEQRQNLSFCGSGGVVSTSLYFVCLFFC